MAGKRGLFRGPAAAVVMSAAVIGALIPSALLWVGTTRAGRSRRASDRRRMTACRRGRGRGGSSAIDPPARAGALVATKPGTKGLPFSVVTITAPDGPLALARRRLSDCVHALADPVPVWDHGTARWSDSIYARLRGAITARTMGRRRVMAGSRAPCRIDVLTLLVDIDTAVAGWEPDAKGTADHLHQLKDGGHNHGLLVASHWKCNLARRYQKLEVRHARQW